MPSGEVAGRAADRRMRAFVGWLRGEVGPVGPCPTLAEIARACGLGTKAGASRLLQRAESQGVIRREGSNASSHQRRTVHVTMAMLTPLAPEPPDVDRAPAAEWRAWLRGARRGDRHIYFVGHLAEERGRPDGARDDAALLAAALATGAAEAGLVLLTTKRVDGEMTYVAVRTAKPLRVMA